MRLLIATTIAFFALWPSVEDVQDLLKHQPPASDSAIAESEPVAEAPAAIHVSAAAESQTSPMVDGGSEVPIAFRDPRIVSPKSFATRWLRPRS